MTPSRLMRTLLPFSLRRTNNATLKQPVFVALAARGAPRPCTDPSSCISNCRCFAQINDSEQWNRDFWFSSTVPRRIPGDWQHGDHKPPDERTIQLGKTVRVLHERLPTLLKEPLPSEILSPSITLHLFPSTHPHLPTVSGRLAYIAALWTAPVAWGRMPLIGNVKLTILSERMVRNGGTSASAATRAEKLIVKWKTCGKTASRDSTGGIYRGSARTAAKDPVDKIRGFIAGASSSSSEGAQPNVDPEDFCGIFIFEFDGQGRIAKHTIEHTEEGGHFDKMTRVVSVTDWLLGQFNGRKKQQEPALAWCEERPDGGSIRFVDRRPRC